MISFHKYAQRVFTTCIYILVERANGSIPRGGVRTPIFDRPSDWDREIKRTGASEWRVCSINELYAISPRFELICYMQRGLREKGVCTSYSWPWVLWTLPCSNTK